MSQDVVRSQPLLEIEHLKMYFPVYGGTLSRLQGYVHAVDDVSLTVNQGETLGLVGESGCGKSTLARTIMRINHPTSGAIRFEGRDILKLSPKELRSLRSELQIIFQDPYSSLDPRMTIGEIVSEPLIVAGVKDKAELRKRVLQVFDVVNLPEAYYDRYPHEFSGGQRQRVSIARALVMKPKLILCDEPVSALDVSIQSQILNLLNRLQKEFNLTYLFISHALNVVRHISDRVCVMYLGKVMELAPSESIFENACHPYTNALLSAIPIPDPTVKRERIILSGELPSPKDPPKGCRFCVRCPYATERCAQEEPLLREVGPGHFVACHLRGEGGR